MRRNDGYDLREACRIRQHELTHLLASLKHDGRKRNAQAREWARNHPDMQGYIVVGREVGEVFGTNIFTGGEAFHVANGKSRYATWDQICPCDDAIRLNRIAI